MALSTTDQVAIDRILHEDKPLQKRYIQIDEGKLSPVRPTDPPELRMASRISNLLHLADVHGKIEGVDFRVKTPKKRIVVKVRAYGPREPAHGDFPGIPLLYVILSVDTDQHGIIVPGTQYDIHPCEMEVPVEEFIEGETVGAGSLLDV